VKDLDYEAWFIEQVKKGEEQVDRGELIEHDEVMKRIEKHIEKKQSGCK
jgi:predicted transcriptional regulator